MANVLKVDVSNNAGDAYATKALTLPGEWFAEYRVAVTQATLDAITAGGGGAGDKATAAWLDFTAPDGDALTGKDFGSTGVWKVVTYFDPVFPDPQGSLTGDVWHTVKVHYDGATVEWTLDGVVVFSYAIASADIDSPTQFGATFAAGYPGEEIYYLDALKVGTTLGGTDIFAPNIQTNLAAFDSTENPTCLSIVVDPGFDPAPQSVIGRVLIAFDDGPLVAAPTWTRIDDTPNLVAGFDLHSGKQTEADRTDTGTATLYLNDTDGLFDPANVSSPYFGKLDGRQIMFQVYDPVNAEWVPQWRGHIDDYGYDINPATNAAGEPLVATIQVDCVDIFDYLGGYQLQPYPIDGDIPPTGSPGIVFYEDTAGTVDDRIVQLLTDAGIDSTMYVVFTGNVSVQETAYSPGDAILNALRDAADAEGPFIANIYVDRYGRFVFHGRRSRFDPETVAASTTPDIWTFTRWKVGDGNAIALDSDRAQMRVLAYSRGRTDIVNSALSWPRHAASEDALVATQVYEDAASISSYAKHSAPPMTDLIIKAGTTTGNTKWQETLLYAKLAVKNKKDPQTRIKTLTLKTVTPTDTRAVATWPVLLRSDISDIVNVSAGYPSGTGLVEKEFYIEGRTVRVRPLNAVYDLVELDLDVSPAEWSMDTHGVFGLTIVEGARARATAAGKRGTVIHA